MHKVENFLGTKGKKLQPKKSKPKDSVFKFRAAARKHCLIKVNLR